MPELPRIAVVTPSYNTGRYLSAAIESVLAQDYPNRDYVVMDGGSTDQTRQILESFSNRVQWISQKDDGQSDAIHQGFSQTQGEILTWLNADDTFAPGAFKTVGEFFAANPDVAMVYGDANYIDAGGRLIGRCAHIERFSLHRLRHYSDFIVQPAAFFRRSAYEAVGGLDTSLHYGMDYDLWLKLAEKFKIAYLPVHLANYRWLTDNKTATGGFRRIDEITELMARHGLDQPAYIRLERVNLLLRDAMAAISQAKVGSSLTSLAKATTIFISSGRAIASVFQPRTWRIIWTGQVLRARAARNCSRGSGQ
jgi:glycosyltransferase involved in cell wall biosynthesis